MPASGGTETKILELFLAKAGWTASKSYLGLSTYSPTALTKAITAKQFGEHEPAEGNEWVRVETDSIEWTKKEEGGNESEAKATYWENKNVIKGAGGAGEFKKLTAGEYKLETFAILEKAKQSEDPAESKGIFVFGKLTTVITINSASTTELAVGALKIEAL